MEIHVQGSGRRTHVQTQECLLPSAFIAMYGVHASSGIIVRPAILHVASMSERTVYQHAHKRHR